MPIFLSEISKALINFPFDNEIKLFESNYLLLSKTIDVAAMTVQTELRQNTSIMGSEILPKNFCWSSLRDNLKTESFSIEK